MKRILLCSLSNNPRNANYLIEGASEFIKPVLANQAPLALVQMMPEDKLPEEILVLCTEELANNQFQPFCDTLHTIWPEIRNDNPVPQIEEIRIADGHNSSEMWEIINCILDKVPPQCELILDITHGYRSFPFLYFTAALYLQILKGVKIQGVYYAMLDVKTDPKPVVDLSLILEMVEWFYAARFFRESGQAHHLAELFKGFEASPSEVSESVRRSYNQVKKLREKIEGFSRCYRLGLPFELGQEAEQLASLLKSEEVIVIKDRIPLFDELQRQIEEFIDPLRLNQQNPNRTLTKGELVLNEAEIKRQAALIDAYFLQGHVPLALGLIRELIISCIIYHNNGTDISGDQWIYRRGKRAEVEHWLGEMSQKIRETKTGDWYNQPIPKIIKQWQYFSDVRNKLMHFGYQQENVNLNVRKLEELQQHWQELKASLCDESKWCLSSNQKKTIGFDTMLTDPKMEKPREGKTLLISPLGMSPGLLFSAVQHLRDGLGKIWLLSSEQAIRSLEEIKKYAQFDGSFDSFLVRDPFTCFNETEPFYNKVLYDAQHAHKVIVNITGGTTALQYVIQDVADRLKGIGIKVEKIALIDRRPVEEQKKEPYKVGDIVFLKD